MFRNKLVLMVTAAALVSFSSAVYAENYPSKEIRIIVPTKPGGSIDRTARSIQKFLPASIGQSVIVENVKGAGGKLGTRKFMNSPKDGYTLVSHFVPGTTIMGAKNPKLIKFSDLAIINLQWSDPVIIIAQKKSGWKSLDDMIKAVKGSPGKYSYGSSGISSAGYVLSARLFKELGLKIKIVPYDGGGKARAAFKGGHVDMTAGGAGGARRVRDSAVVLGAFWNGKVPGWPEAKPLSKLLGKFNASIPEGGAFRFIAVHKGVKEKHPARFKKLVAAMKKAVQSSEFKAFAKKSKVGSEWNGPENSTAILKKIDAGFVDMIGSAK